MIFYGALILTLALLVGMATRRYYLGSTGPFLYDDEKTFRDGTPYRGLQGGNVNISGGGGNPSGADDNVFLDDDGINIVIPDSEQLANYQEITFEDTNGNILGGMAFLSSILLGYGTLYLRSQGEISIGVQKRNVAIRSEEGYIKCLNLPISDPGEPGALWYDQGTLKVSGEPTRNVYYTDEGAGEVRVFDLLAGTDNLVASPGGVLRWVAVSQDLDYVYYCNYNGIFRRSIGGGIEETVVDTSGTANDQPFGLALDDNLDRMFWTDQGSFELFRSNRTGGSVVSLLGSPMAEARGIGLHRENQEVYVGVHDSGIEKYNYDGSGAATPVTAQRAIGIAIDETRGHLYWTVNNAGEIRRSNLDGTDEVVFSTDPDIPYGLTYEPLEDKLYFADNGLNAICEIERIGATFSQIVTGLNTPRAVATDFRNVGG